MFNIKNGARLIRKDMCEEISNFVYNSTVRTAWKSMHIGKVRKFFDRWDVRMTGEVSNLSITVNAGCKIIILSPVVGLLA